MRKLIVLVSAALLLALSGPAAAQTTSTGPASSVTIFFVACETSAVINFSGEMLASENLFYQVFAGPNGSGASLTALREVNVSGQYAVSVQPAFDGGATVPAGSTASVRVLIARVGNPRVISFETTVNDIQDGCANPQNPLADSADTGVGTTPSVPSLGILIRSPFGGFINNNIGEFVSPTPEPPVVIGARRPPFYRSDTPGIIFAECDQYLPRSAPGRLYDNDNIVIFWSWYARTAAQVQDHIEKALYDVKFQNAPLNEVVITPIEQRGSLFWVFYYQVIGNLSPGTYGVSFNLSWKEPTFDGFERFGPGTKTETVNSTCTFTVERNPTDAPVSYNLMYSIR